MREDPCLAHLRKLKRDRDIQSVENKKTAIK